MVEQSGPHDVFEAVADPTRRAIIHLLADESLSIAAITAHFTITRTAVNKHLRILMDAGLVSSSKAGRETRYSLHPGPLAQLQEWVSDYERYWDDRLTALRRVVEDDRE